MIAAFGQSFNRAGAVALGNFGDTQASRRLKALQRDPDPEVAEEATIALGNLDDLGTVP